MTREKILKKLRKLSPGQALIIEWDDAWAGSDWHHLSEANETISDLYTVRSIGFFYGVTNEQVMLIQNVCFESGHYFGHTVMPLGMVRSVEVLEDVSL